VTTFLVQILDQLRKVREMHCEKNGLIPISEHIWNEMTWSETTNLHSNFLMSSQTNQIITEWITGMPISCVDFVPIDGFIHVCSPQAARELITHLDAPRLISFFSNDQDSPAKIHEATKVVCGIVNRAHSEKNWISISLTETLFASLCKVCESDRISFSLKQTLLSSLVSHLDNPARLELLLRSLKPWLSTSEFLVQTMVDSLWSKIPSYVALKMFNLISLSCLIDLARSNESKLSVLLKHCLVLENKESSVGDSFSQERTDMLSKLCLLIENKVLSVSARHMVVSILPLCKHDEISMIFDALVSDVSSFITFTNKSPMSVKLLLDFYLQTGSHWKVSKAQRKKAFSVVEKLILSSDNVDRTIQQSFFRGYCSLSYKGAWTALLALTNKSSEDERLLGLDAFLCSLMLCDDPKKITEGFQFLRKKLRNESSEFRLKVFGSLKTRSCDFKSFKAYASSAQESLQEILYDTLQSKGIDESIEEISWFKRLGEDLIYFSACLDDSISLENRKDLFRLGEELLWRIASHDVIDESKLVGSYWIAPRCCETLDLQIELMNNVFDTYSNRFLTSRPDFWYTFGKKIAKSWVKAVDKFEFLEKIPKIHELLGSDAQEEIVSRKRDLLSKQLDSLTSLAQLHSSPVLIDFVASIMDQASKSPKDENGLLDGPSTTTLWKIFKHFTSLSSSWENDKLIVEMFRILLHSSSCFDTFPTFKILDFEKKKFFDLPILNSFLSFCLNASKAISGRISDQARQVLRSILSRFQELDFNSGGYPEWFSVPILVDFVRWHWRIEDFCFVFECFSSCSGESMTRIDFIQNYLQTKLLHIKEGFRNSEDNIVVDGEATRVFDMVCEMFESKEQFLQFPILVSFIEVLSQSTKIGNYYSMFSTLLKSKLVPVSGQKKKLKRNQMKRLRDQIVVHLLKMSRSAIYIKFVANHVARWRSDLVRHFVGGKVCFGQFFVHPSSRAPIPTISVQVRSVRGNARPKKKNKFSKAAEKALDKCFLFSYSGPCCTVVDHESDVKDDVKDLDEYFLFSNSYGISRWLPRDASRLAKQVLSKYQNPVRDKKQRLLFLQKWTSLPTTSVEEILALLVEEERQAIQSNADYKNSGSEEPFSAVQTNIVELILRALARSWTISPACIPYLLHKNILSSNLFRVSIFCVERSMKFQPPSLISNLISNLWTTEGLKITIIKQLIRMLTFRPRQECFEILVSHSSKPDLHRDIALALLVSAIDFLRVPVASRFGWEIIESLSRSNRPEILLCLFSVFPEGLVATMPSGIFKDEVTENGLKELFGQLSVHRDHCRIFAEKAILPLCHSNFVKSLESMIHEDASESDMSSEQIEKMLERKKIQIQDVHALALCSLQIWYRYGLFKECSQILFLKLTEPVSRLKSNAQRTQAVLLTRWSYMLDAILCAEGFHQHDVFVQTNCLDMDFSLIKNLFVVLCSNAKLPEYKVNRVSVDILTNQG